MSYGQEKKPLIVLAGKEYGSGSSRDWAAKGTRMLGIKAVIAESYERIHRSNLIMMGVLPLQFKEDDSVLMWGVTGEETYDILGLEGTLEPLQDILVRVSWNEKTRNFTTQLRIDTPKEIDYYTNGGILPYVMRQLT